MSYKALLFCPDDRTGKVVTQVLSELEFQVDACNEPFTAVKKLMASHFDAVVVDCDNEQNATLLFKSARNSEFNQASLSVAVVEGQSGVAKAFRIGANLVLTKPINVEQSKGTLRVARGLLRKNEAAKASGKAPEAIPHTSPLSGAPAVPKPAFVTTPAPALSPAMSAASSSAFEVEKEPGPSPEPAEAAFIESVSEQPGQIHAPGGNAKQYPWQAMSKPAAEPMSAGMASALKQANETVNKPDSSFGVGQGAAVAPAKDTRTDDEIAEFPEETDAHSSSPSATIVQAPAAGSTANWTRIAAIVLVAAAGYAIYRGGTLLHWKMPALSMFHSTAPATATNSAVKPQTTPLPAMPSSSAIVNSTGNAPQAGAVNIASHSPSAPSAVSASAPAQVPEIIVAGPVAKKPAVPATSFDAPAPQGVVKTIGDDAVFVDTRSRRPAPPQPAPVDNVEPAAPDTVAQDSKANDQAISGLMSLPSPVPRQTLKVSQGISQGLLIKKVAPVYPAQAMLTHLQGSVQLLATISKDGDITQVKVLNGESVLARAAADAVKQWKYKPYLLDGQPTEIQTQITVNFALP